MSGVVRSQGRSPRSSRDAGFPRGRPAPAAPGRRPRPEAEGAGSSGPLRVVPAGADDPALYLAGGSPCVPGPGPGPLS
jgi:hypothetical protein